MIEDMGDMGGNEARRQRDRDEALETRDLMRAALEQSGGRPMRSDELARLIGRTRQQVTFAAGRWTLYFEKETSSRTSNCKSISLHRHLAAHCKAGNLATVPT
jgi:hypothetical protein